jgi:hypothetical protein
MKQSQSDRLRPLNQPRPVTVELDRKQLPLSITDENNSHDVIRILEVWRVDDEWWRKPVGRRYVEVILDNGSRQVLFEDIGSGEWFVQGGVGG